MGRSVITITVTGNHGCDRTAKEGEPLRASLCDDPSCVDCNAQRLVNQLADRNDVEEATHAHWPEQSGPVDDLVTRTRRSGSF